MPDVSRLPVAVVGSVATGQTPAPDSKEKIVLQEDRYANDGEFAIEVGQGWDHVNRRPVVSSAAVSSRWVSAPTLEVRDTLSRSRELIDERSFRSRGFALSASAEKGIARIKASAAAYAEEREARESSTETIDFLRSYVYSAGYLTVGSKDEETLARGGVPYVRRDYRGASMDLVFTLRARRSAAESNSTSSFRAELEGKYKIVEAKLSAAFNSAQTFKQMSDAYEIGVRVRTAGGNPDLLPRPRAIATWDDLQAFQFEILTYITSLEQSPATTGVQDVRVTRAAIDQVVMALRGATSFQTAQAMVSASDLTRKAQEEDNQLVTLQPGDTSTSTSSSLVVAHEAAEARVRAAAFNALVRAASPDTTKGDPVATWAKVAAEQTLLESSRNHLEQVLRISGGLLPRAEGVVAPRTNELPYWSCPIEFVVAVPTRAPSALDTLERVEGPLYALGVLELNFDSIQEHVSSREHPEKERLKGDFESVRRRLQKAIADEGTTPKAAEDTQGGWIDRKSVCDRNSEDPLSKEAWEELCGEVDAAPASRLYAPDALLRYFVNRHSRWVVEFSVTLPSGYSGYITATTLRNGNPTAEVFNVGPGNPKRWILDLKREALQTFQVNAERFVLYSSSNSHPGTSNNDVEQGAPASDLTSENMNPTLEGKARREFVLDLSKLNRESGSTGLRDLKVRRREGTGKLGENVSAGVQLRWWPASSLGN